MIQSCLISTDLEPYKDDSRYQKSVVHVTLRWDVVFDFVVSS